MISWELILIAIALASESFTVSLNSFMDMSKPGDGLQLKVASYFTLFQIVFLAMGWGLGTLLFSLFEFVLLPMGFAIFSIIGIKLIWEAFKLKPQDRSFDLQQFRLLLGASLAAGFNALIVGIGIRLVSFFLFEAVFIVSIVVLLLSFTGSFIGSRYGCRYRGKWAKVIGGTLLIVVGITCLLRYQGIL